MKHFLLHTFGSLGDLHPFMALGLGLQARGHKASIGTSEPYRASVEKAGLGFYPIRPNFDPHDPVLLAKIMDSKTGTQYVFKDLTLPHLRDTYADLMRTINDVDVLVSATLTLAVPMIAEKTGIPWISTVLAPVSFFSAHDPSVVNAPMSEWISKRGPDFNRWFFNMGKRFTNSWAKPLYKFRKELGLPKGQSPFFEAQHSPQLALALFSKHFAAPQKDWPKNSHITGFLFYDGEQSLEQDLESFLQAGEPPVVFTLGSAAVHTAGDFYIQSLEAVKQLGCRVVLLVGRENVGKFSHLPKNIFVSAYAPYSQLFPRASLVVHQGGIGTTAQVLKAGKPALVMPFAHDQFDNGLRVKRLGVGLTIKKQNYKPVRVRELLERLLNDNSIRTRAEVLGQNIRAEQALEDTCNLIASQTKERQ
jgi:rhamnosyltransferase subunit B